MDYYKFNSGYIAIFEVEDEDFEYAYDYTIYDKYFRALDGGILGSECPLAHIEVISQVSSEETNAEAITDIAMIDRIVALIDFQDARQIHIVKSTQFFEKNDNAYAVYQIKDGCKHCFRSFDAIADTKKKLSLSDYELVSSKGIKLKENEIELFLDMLYEKHNTQTYSYSRSMSVSDIVAIKQAGRDCCYYFVDRIGFKKINI